MDLPPRSSFGRLVGVVRHGHLDPCASLEGNELWWAARTDHGPATLHLVARDGAVDAEAFGPGTDEILSRVPGLLGHDDRPDDLRPVEPVVARLVQRHGSPRLARSGTLFPTLVATILAQRVTSLEAARGWRAVAMAFGEAAPGPVDLRLPPAAETLAGVPYFAFHRFGIERKRADAVIRVARVAHRLEEGARAGIDDARRRMLAVPGVGPWTVESVIGPVFGDPDAVPVGDYGLPDAVVHAFTGARKGTDAQMLELLEPYRGQRGRVLRLLMIAGSAPARIAPRAPIVPIAKL